MTPILLLKTKNTPHDGYDDFFSARNYTPTFVPVLEHTVHDENLARIKQLFESGGLIPGPERKYGGLIFTSQRAVEAFMDVLGRIDEKTLTPSSENLAIYSVGPATARALSSLRDRYLPHASVHGAECGTGEQLAPVILRHYNSLYPGFCPRSGSWFSSSGQVGSGHGSGSGSGSDKDGDGDAETETGRKPPLLFLVGEKHRDVIPKALLGAPGKERIMLDEVVVYKTGVVGGFEGEFERVLLDSLGSVSAGAGACAGARVVWVVVFSPTGCDAMVRVLERVRQNEGKKEKVFVATIGPTTRDHLVGRYGFQPQVCADVPSPEGVGGGIEEFMGALKGE